MSRLQVVRSGCWAGVTLGALLAGGCGGSGGPERYQVSGTVNFNGQPVPSGTVIFDPDTASGGKGPQGMAQIQNGKFDTAAQGRGVVGGPHIVRISGFKDPKEAAVDKSGEKVVPVLFNNYTVKADLPLKASTQTYDVPASAAKDPSTQPKANAGP